ncbi:MAG: cytochrome P450 [Proteobacteria bacterium]|nr:cytochrome P450 [Pseudomonadota bacterium]
MSTQSLLIPARPAPPAAALSFPRFLRAVRTNALTMWPEEAYETNVLRQSFLGRERLLVNDPDAIHRILVDNPGNYLRTAASIRILRPITGRGLLLSEGDDWRLQRRTIAPALAPRVIPMLARHIAACTQDAVARLRAAAGAPVDLLAAMQTLALDIAGRSMFSLEVTRYGEQMRAALNVYAQKHARPHLLDMLLPPGIPAPRDFGRRRFSRRWMALMDEIMQARLAAPASDAPRDLFDLLMAARDPETGAGFSHEQLRDQVATLILAGHETTAVTLFWALTLLAQAPAEQEALAAEASALSFAEDDAAATLGKLVRTRAMVNETLRLYPPAFTMARQAQAADRAGGIDIPAGALLLIAPWVLHRHRRLWRDPDALDPSRFMPDAPPPPRFAYLPFGTGPRVCVGAQFALAEAALALGATMKSFQVELADRRPVLPVAVVTTQPDHAPPFRLRPR